MSATYNLRLHLEKETFKFSCAHFTIFDATHKEPLHGHNYRVSLSISLKDDAFTELVNFADVKGIVKGLCDAWDERILVPTGSEHVQVTTENREINIKVCGKRYVFPEDETALLNLPNITTECLAKELGDRLVDGIRAHKQPAFLHIHAVEVRVDETDGQGASVRLDF